MTTKKKNLAPTIPDAAASPAPPSPPKDGSDDDYEARNAMDDIMRAQQHMSNPDMMERVQKHVGRKVKALQGIRTIKDLRGVYDDKYGAGALKKLQKPRDKA